VIEAIVRKCWKIQSRKVCLHKFMFFNFGGRSLGATLNTTYLRQIEAPDRKTLLNFLHQFFM